MTKKHYLVMLFLFVLSLIIYGETFTHKFINFDDPALAYENPQVRNFNLKQIFTSTVAEDYIPLTVTSYAVDHALFGMDPAFFHLHNVLLNAFNVLLVFLFIYFLSLGSFPAATITALLFAVHPLHVESVAWVAERKDVLSGFFSLAALIFYERYLSRRRIKLYIFSFICLSLALFAKFMAVSIPGILILLELQKRQPLKKILIRMIPFAVLSGIFTYIHMALHNSTSGSAPLSLMRGIDSLAFYLTKTFYPVGLSVFYEQTVVRVAWWEYLIAAIVIGTFIASIIRAKNSREALVFGGLFFLATILPVLQIVPFGNLFAFGDRFMYLPSIGIFYVLGILVANLMEKKSLLSQKALPALWVVIIVLLAWQSNQRSSVWQDSKTLWADAAQTYPQSSVARNNLGLVFLNEANRPRAIQEFILAAQLRSDYADPYVNLGLAYLDLKQINEAAAALNEALRINPKLPNAHVNAALVLEAQNKLDQAGEHYLRALELDPDLSAARYNLGVIYYKLKQQDKALAILQETANRDPYLAEAHHGIGVILVEKGQMEAAVPYFEKAATLDRLYEAPRIQLINIYNRQGKTDLVAQEVQELQQVQKELQSQPPSRPRR